MRDLRPGLLPFAFVLLGAVDARADWPMFRHDAKRSATSSSAPANVTSPTAYWRYYLGGSVSSRQVLYDDQAKEVLYISAGKLIAKLPDDTFRWETPVIGASQLFGIADLDGDGTRDVVIGSQNHIFVIASTNGQTLGGRIEWSSDDAQFGSSPQAWIADFDGDGHPDVFASECTCCGTSGPGSGGGMFFFPSFASRKPAWTPPAPDCGDGTIHVGDFDGNGLPDLALFSGGLYKVVRGKDGMVLATSAPFPSVTGVTNPALAIGSNCFAANVDGRPGDESICFQSVNYAGTNGGRRIFAYSYDATKTPAAQLLWHDEAVDPVNDKVAWLDGSVVDLDLDKTFELVVTTTHAGKDHTSILDAATGAELAAVDGQSLQAIADLTGDGRGTVVTWAAGAGYTASTFHRFPSVAVMQSWQLPDAYDGVAFARDNSRPTSFVTSPLALDLDGDGKNELVMLRKVAQPTDKPALVALKMAAQGAPTVYGSYEMDAGLSFLTTDHYAGVTRGYDQIVTARSDGFLIVLDNKLGATNAFVDPELALNGLRVGGYVPDARSAGFIAPSLDGARDTAIVADSRGYLVSLDPSSANLVVPPSKRWELRSAYEPTAVPHLEGNLTGLACYLPPPPGSPPSTPGRLRALHAADGATLWESMIPYWPTLDIVPGDVNNDGVPDLLVASDDFNLAKGHFSMRDGTNGAPLWAADNVQDAGGYFAHASLGDWNGDGVVDAIIGSDGDAKPHVLDGLKGTEIGTGPSIGYTATFTIADVDGDGVEEYTAQNMYVPSRTLKHDLQSTLWVGTDDDRPYEFGARAACPGGTSIWVLGSSKIPGQVRYTPMNGPNVGKSFVRYYAGGSDFATLADVKATGQVAGALSDIVIKPNLLGPSTNPVALFGSGDGWLYAIDVCQSTLVWAYNFHASVGAPILADTNGDGKDEVLVGAADGYLYDLRQKIVDAPANVYDTDASLACKEIAGGTITTVDTLYACWSSVGGAVSYSYAVYSGTTLVQDFTDTPKTSLAITGLTLVPGKHYKIAVRANSPVGSSVETVSPGVLVAAPVVADMGPPVDDFGAGSADLAVARDMKGAAPDAAGGKPPEGGCSCRVGGTRDVPAGDLALALLVGAALLHRRRRR